MKKENNFIFWLSLIKKIYILFPLKKIKLVMIFFFIILQSLLELVSFSLFVPFVSSLLGVIDNNALSPLIPFYSKIGLDILSLEKITIYIVFVLSLKLIFSIVLEGLILNIGLQSRAVLIKKMVSLYLNSNYKKLIETNSADYINSVQFYISQHRGAVIILAKIFADLVFLFFTLIYVTYIFGFYTIPSGMVLLLLVLIFDKFTKRKIEFYGKKMNIINVKIIRLISECLKGFKEIKIYNLSDLFVKKIKEISLEHSRIDTRYGIIIKLPRLIYEYLFLVFFIIVGMFAYNFYNTKLINLIPDFSIIFLILLRFIPLSSNFSNGISSLRHSNNAISILFDYFSKFKLDEKLYLKNPNEILKENKYKSFESLELKNIDFRYHEHAPTILKDTNIKIIKKDFIGIYGASGSGKTTLIDLFLGILSPTSGEIYFNEKKINPQEIGYLNFLTYVPQENFLIDDTIANNIVLDNEINEIDQLKLNQAAEKAGLLDFILSLPDKFNTNLGESGKFLSGGQRQRISIARAIYSNKEVIILDESTNALDDETENEVMRHLKLLNEHFTIIVISHSKHVLSNCNKIFKLKSKKLIMENNLLSKNNNPSL